MAALILVPSITTADSIDTPPSPKVQYQLLANSIATAYGVQIPLLRAVVNCESSFNPTATHISKREQSYGLVQINRLAHPNISIQQAEDPTFALTYLAKGLKSNPQQWSCFSKVRGKIKKVSIS